MKRKWTGGELNSDNRSMSSFENEVGVGSKMRAVNVEYPPITPTSSYGLPTRTPVPSYESKERARRILETLDRISTPSREIPKPDSLSISQKINDALKKRGQKRLLVRREKVAKTDSFREDVGISDQGLFEGESNPPRRESFVLKMEAEQVEKLKKQIVDERKEKEELRRQFLESQKLGLDFQKIVEDLRGKLDKITEERDKARHSRDTLQLEVEKNDNLKESLEKLKTDAENSLETEKAKSKAMENQIRDLKAEIKRLEAQLDNLKKLKLELEIELKNERNKAKETPVEKQPSPKAPNAAPKISPAPKPFSFVKSKDGPVPDQPAKSTPETKSFASTLTKTTAKLETTPPTFPTYNSRGTFPAASTSEKKEDGGSPTKPFNPFSQKMASENNDSPYGNSEGSKLDTKPPNKPTSSSFGTGGIASPFGKKTETPFGQKTESPFGQKTESPFGQKTESPFMKKPSPFSSQIGTGSLGNDSDGNAQKSTFGAFNTSGPNPFQMSGSTPVFGAGNAGQDSNNKGMSTASSNNNNQFGSSGSNPIGAHKFQFGGNSGTQPVFGNPSQTPGTNSSSFNSQPATPFGHIQNKQKGESPRRKIKIVGSK